MKQIIILLLTIITFVFSGCEKHDGKLYFKQICQTEYAGKKYIDQCPLSYIFAPSVTPSIRVWEDYGIEFTTNLCEKREETTIIRIQLFMHCDDAENIIGHRFEFAFNEAYVDTYWEYFKYCRENGINVGEIYALTLPIESCVIKSGWSIVDSKDKNNTCRGNFELKTCSDEVITGSFNNVILPTSNSQ